MAESETIVAHAERIVFSKGNFYIFYTEEGFSVKGNSNEDITPGIKYEITGKWGEYNGFPQLSASQITAIKDDRFRTTLIADFLANYLPGIGDKTAERLADSYGEEVLEVLAQGDEEQIKQSKSLTKKKLNGLKNFIADNEDILYEKLNLRLLSLPFGIIDKIVEVYGLKFDAVQQNPFVLMPVEGVSFEMCEHIFEQYDLDEYSVDRFGGAIEAALIELHIDTGNSYFGYEELNNKAFRLLFDRKNCDSEAYLKSFFAAMQRLIDMKKVVVYTFINNKVNPVSVNSPNARIALARYTKTEIDIKKQIFGFLNAKTVPLDEDKARKKIKKLAILNDIELDTKQEEALLMCMSKPLSIISGGPGTGKTTIMGLLAQHFRNERISYAFCAPTGRAAKRLSEAIDDKAYTIHRILGISKTDDDSEISFCNKNHLDPIDARVVVVDEMSMVDMEIFLLLLDAIDTGSSLILVGDPNQLPSVGPGNVLRNLLAYEPVPKVELSYVFRQQEGSLIASNAYRILNKETLVDNGTEFQISDFVGEEEAEEFIRKLYLEVYMKNDDVVILSPTKQNNLGTMRLNELLQRTVINEDNGFQVRSNLILHIGDRVMQIKNDYQIEYELEEGSGELGKGVYNGELGEVVGIDEVEEVVLIKFDDGKTVPYTKQLLENIELAYAMTVHKAQGCEFDTVILVLGKFNYMLSNRKILYTAVTRAKRKLVIVNVGDRLNKMILAEREGERFTSLLDFLRTTKN